MKRKKWMPLAIAVILCFTSMTPVHGAIAYENIGASGNYMLIYNTAENVTTSASSGVVTVNSVQQSPSPFSSVFNQEDILFTPEESEIQEEICRLTEEGHTVKDIVEKEGEIYYVIEPDLQQIDIEETDIQLWKDRFFKQDEDAVSLQLMLNNKSVSKLGEKEVFSAQDNCSNTSCPTYNKTYTMGAICKAEGIHCEIYVEEENEQVISTEAAIQIQQEFDTKVAPTLLENFGSWYVNSNNKIIILLHDIRDDNYHKTSNTYVAGYFNPQELMYGMGASTSFPTSVSLLHLDLFPLMGNRDTKVIDATKAYSTMAHEFQHLISMTDYVSSFPSQDRSNQLWWNEMMSMAAEDMLYGTLTSRITQFNNSNKVRNGAALTYTAYSQNQNDLGACYGAAYLFGQYLKLQTEGLQSENGERGGAGIFKQILKSSYGDYRAIVEGLHSVGYAVTDFAELNRNFRIATVLNETGGYFGFMGESAFHTVAMPARGNKEALNLQGTSAIVVPLNESLAYLQTPGRGINYVVFSKSDVNLEATENQYEIASLTFENRRGKPVMVNDFTSSDELIVEAYISNKGSVPVTPSVYVAFYDSENRLVQIAISDTQSTEEIQAEDVGLACVTVDMGESKNATQMKVFILSEDLELQPMSKAQSLEIN